MELTYEQWHKLGRAITGVYWDHGLRSRSGQSPFAHFVMGTYMEWCGAEKQEIDNLDTWSRIHWLEDFYKTQPYTHTEECPVCEEEASYWDDHDWWDCVICHRAGGRIGLGSRQVKQPDGTTKVDLVNVCRHCAKTPEAESLREQLKHDNSYGDCNVDYKGPFSRYIKENYRTPYHPTDDMTTGRAR